MNIIAAVDNEGGIGKNGSIPWRKQNDLRMFRLLTYGKTMMVGRRTYENMGPLDGRRVYVLSESGNFDYSPDNVLWVRGPEAVHLVDEEVWIAGGASVYQRFIGEAKNVYLSRIPGNYNCDTFFPEDELEENYEPISKVEVHGFDLWRYTLNN